MEAKVESENAVDDTIAGKYINEYSPAIGKGFPAAVIDDLCEFIKDAVPREEHVKHAEQSYEYIMLEKKGWSEKISPLADQWAMNRDNIERASIAANRKVEVDESDLVSGFCIFQLHPNISLKWLPSLGGLKIPLEDEMPNKATVVFVALADLGPWNGFFIPLKRGEDVCLEGDKVVLFPPTGGGKGLFICLNL